MTDEVKQAAAVAADPNLPGEDTRTPMQKAIEGGYKQEPQPSKEERAAEIVAALEHAVKNNAPVTNVMVAEIRDLLGVGAPDETPPAPVAEAHS